MKEIEQILGGYSHEDLIRAHISLIEFFSIEHDDQRIYAGRKRCCFQKLVSLRFHGKGE